MVLGLLLSTSTHAGLFKKKTWLKENNWDQSQYWGMCKAYIYKEMIKACNCDVPGPRDIKKAESEELFSPLHTCLKQMEAFGEYENLNTNPVEKVEEKIESQSTESQSSEGQTSGESKKVSLEIFSKTINPTSDSILHFNIRKTSQVTKGTNDP